MHPKLAIGHTAMPNKGVDDEAFFLTSLVI
jgi:hypothetical protein